MRNFRIGNVRLVSGIEEQKRLVFARVRDPRRKLLAHGYGAGWIIRKTEINQIDVFLRRLGDKIIFRRAAQIKKPFVAAVFSRGAGIAGHHVRIDIGRIDRIGNRDFVLLPENVEDVTAITF